MKTFLNGTMPALTNIKVGSLCGTSGAEGTRVWPFFSKNSRKERRISFVEVIVTACKCPAALRQGDDLALRAARG